MLTRSVAHLKLFCVVICEPMCCFHSVGVRGHTNTHLYKAITNTLLSYPHMVQSHYTMVCGIIVALCETIFESCCEHQDPSKTICVIFFITIHNFTILKLSYPFIPNNYIIISSLIFFWSSTHSSSRLL